MGAGLARIAAGRGVRAQQLAPGFVQQVQVRDASCVAPGKCWRERCRACPGGATSDEELALTVDEADAAWEGSTGFVQELLAGLNLDPSSTIAHVAGVRAMEEAVRGQFAELGFAPESVRANY